MRFSVLGASHHHASVDMREALAVPAENLAAMAQSLCADPRISEAFVLSTCNRIEAYVVPTHDGDDVLGLLEAALIANRGVDPNVRSKMVARSGEEAVHHLLRVASSLDSMVVGEPQILGQLKEAASVARDAGTVGAILDHMLSQAFRTAKRVRTETGIARSVVSIGSVAVDLATRIFSDISKCKVLLVGAGEMGEVTAQGLASAGAARVYVTNRSFDRAAKLANTHGWRARPLGELTELLAEVDVVLTSTAAREPIITAAMLKPIIRQRKYRPLFIVDIAVPRDVEPAVAEMETIYLYNVDDLEEVSRDNLDRRQQEAIAAELLARESVVEIGRWYASLTVKPTLAAIRSRAMEVAQAELQRSFKKSLRHLENNDQKSVETMAMAMVSKILHPTMATLRSVAGRDDGPAWLQMARMLHGVADAPNDDEDTVENMSLEGPLEPESEGPAAPSESARNAS